MTIAQSIGKHFFKHFHGNNLVYNTCWEDPRCDKTLLELTSDSRVVMITSAGCNALSYLLDSPAKIHAIDMNPRQNALLEFKIELMKACDFDDFFEFFGKGEHIHSRTIYFDVIRSNLAPVSRIFWDEHIDYFGYNPLNRNFYYSGTSGLVAWLFATHLKIRKSLHENILSLFEAQSIDEQKELYRKIEPRVFNRLVQFIVNRHLTMCLLGVPKSQQKLFVNRYQTGAFGFIKERLKHVFTELPLQDNYFYRVYFSGSYTDNCCPEYLEYEYFEKMRNLTDRITLHTSTISEFLTKHPGQYTHFVLLDHQDWLAAYDQDTLEEEWRLILRNSAPGAKILMRSASADINFIPDSVHNYVDFERSDTTMQHHLDRVGTYASVQLGTIHHQLQN